MNKEINQYFETKTKELMVTIFNEKTYEENMKYRIENGIQCAYSCCDPLTSVEKHKGLFVLEANTSTNTIKGIGFIKTKEDYQCRKIYTNTDYNNYCYTGYYHIKRENMTEKEETVMQLLDELCFYGKTHLKRYSGIKRFPRKWIYNLRETIDLLETITKMFQKRT
jgi:hypothetical protein